MNSAARLVCARSHKETVTGALDVWRTEDYTGDALVERGSPMNSSVIRRMKDPARRPEHAVADQRLYAYMARRDDRPWSKVARLFQRLTQALFLGQVQSGATHVRMRKDWD